MIELLDDRRGALPNGGELALFVEDDRDVLEVAVSGLARRGAWGLPREKVEKRSQLRR
jgi:hypothetical protein